MTDLRGEKQALAEAKRVSFLVPTPIAQKESFSMKKQVLSLSTKGKQAHLR